MVALGNGMRVIVRENSFTPVVTVQIVVGVGSIDEGVSERGMAHFLEHMLFKGTRRRAAGQVAAEIEAAGGEINAYTTFDHTTYYLTIPSAGFGTGLDVLFDAVTDSVLDPAEFEREREVILEEIRRSKDDPGSRVGQAVFAHMFAGTEASRPILGTEDSVGAFTAESLRNFYRRHYRPERMTLLVVGDVGAEQVLTAVKTHMAMTEAAAPAAVTPTRDLPVRTPAGLEAVVLRGPWKQPRVEIAFPAPGINDAESIAMDIAAFALGGGEMSRLNRRLRDGAGIPVVRSGLYCQIFGGIFDVSARPQPERLLEAVSLLAAETARLVECAPVTEEELARARANLRSDRVHRDETVEGQARSLGQGLLTRFGLGYDEVCAALMESAQSLEVADVTRRFLSPGRALIVALVDQEARLEAEDLKSAFLKGWQDGQVPSTPPESDGHGVTGLRPAGQRETQSQVSVCDLGPGLKVIHFRNPMTKMVTATLATAGGLRAESARTAGLFHLMSGMTASATRKHGYADFQSRIESHGASMNGFSGRDSIGLHFQSLASLATDLADLVRQCLLEAVYPEEQWEAHIREADHALLAQAESPTAICFKKFQELIYGIHPYRHPVLGNRETLHTFRAPDVLKEYSAWVRSGPWVLAVVSPWSHEEAVGLAKAMTEGFTPLASRKIFESDGLLDTGKGGEAFIRQDREQTHLVRGFPGLSWSDPGRAALDVLVSVLGGHGGRLFTELRDKEGLAYSVSPILSYGCNPGAVGAYIGCAPEKVVKAKAGLRDAFDLIADKLAAPEEVARAKAAIIGSHQMGLQRSEAITSTMALMELYGIGWEDYKSYPLRVAAVTAEEVRAVARRILGRRVTAEVAVGPDA